jgi:dihydroneopterin aldolase
MTLTVELAAIELYGQHGVTQVEIDRGQRFLLDVWLDVSDAALSDRIVDAVDYREVAEEVRRVFEGRRYHLLEALAAATADALLARFPDVERARVRVRKPEVRLDPPVDYSAVTAESRR